MTCVAEMRIGSVHGQALEKGELLTIGHVLSLCQKKACSARTAAQAAAFHAYTVATISWHAIPMVREMKVLFPSQGVF